MIPMWVWMLVSGCAPIAVEPSLEDLQRDLEALGPYAVGHTFAEVSYRPPGSDEDRVLNVEIWYPAPEGQTGTAAVYAISGVVDVPSDIAIAEAPAADGPFPVAVYSHGSGGVGMLAYPTAERLASRGWVVVAPDHAGNTSIDTFFGDADSFVRILYHRPLDVQAVLDAVDTGLPGSRAEGLGSTDDVFMWGHSFGGATTLISAGAEVDFDLIKANCTEDCELLEDPDVEATFRAGLADARVDAAAPQAPALFPLLTRASLKAFNVPLQVQSAAGDRTTPDDEEAGPLWSTVEQAEARWVRLKKGGHYSFITTCDDIGVDLVESFAPGATLDGCGETSTPLAEVIPVLGTYLIAWAEGKVLGRTEVLEVVDVLELHPDVAVRLP